MKALFLVLVLLGLSGCVKLTEEQMEYKKADEQQRLNPEIISLENSERVTVKRISVIRDDMAYSNRRGIYIIVDNETGKEYIGVSGVGISELGSQSYSCGKSMCSRTIEN